MPTQLTQAQAQHLFSTHAFLLISGLPPRTQLTIDAHSTSYLTESTFQGIKLIPPGWHCLSWGVPSTSFSSHTVNDTDGSRQQGGEGGGGVGAFGVRNIFLRHFSPGEVVLRRFDAVNEELVLPPTLTETAAIPTTAGTKRTNLSRRRRRRRRRLSSSDQPQDPPTVLSKEYLQTIDAHLLVYPEQALAKWRRATKWLSSEEGGKVVARVVGMQAGSGDVMVDSMAAGSDIEVDAGDGGRGKRTWGKPRPPQERQEGEDMEKFEALLPSDEDEEGVGAEAGRKRKRDPITTTPPLTSGYDGDEEEDDPTLRFTTFDLKRSWPPGSTGETLTRWSRDKSYLLTEVLRRSSTFPTSTDGDAAGYAGLMCEVELAFLLFHLSYNHHALTVWTDMISLFCLSPSFIGASNGWSIHPSSLPSSLPSQSNQTHTTNKPTLQPHTAFLRTLAAQFDLLPSSFWTDQESGKDEANLVRQLETLRANIGRALISRTVVSNEAEGEDRGAELIAAWRHLSYLVKTRFGWDLDRRLDEEKEVDDDLEAEEGEDAPIVVEL